MKQQKFLSGVAIAGIWIVLAVTTILFFSIYSCFTQDDAYITYRYARNISSGLGFVFNPGEHVLGTTTPLFTLLLAAVTTLSGLDTATASLAIGLVSLWISSIFLFHLVRPQSTSMALAVALIYLTNPFLRYCMGMESYFLLCLSLAALWAFLNGRLRLSALLGGLLALVRYEMGLLLALLALYDFFKKRSIPTWIWPGVVPAAGWLLYAIATFGNPLPLSMLSKLTAVQIPFLVGFAFYWHTFIQENPLFLTLIPVTITGVIRVAIWRRVPLSDGLIFLFSILYALIAGIFAGSFPWYFAPLIPGVSLAIAYGAALIPQKTPTDPRADGFRLPLKWTAVLRHLGAALIISIQLLFWNSDYGRYQNQPFDLRQRPYAEISAWLNANALPGQSIAAYEIGYLGYYTRLKIYDYPALVTPGLFPWLNEGVSSTLFHCLQLYSPDYALTTYEDPLQINILENDHRYRLEKVFANRFLLYRKGTNP